MKHIFLVALFITIILLASGCAVAVVDIHINCDKSTVPISDHLYGIFFEDINFAADGGLYGELIQNRSFEYYPIPGGNPFSEQYHPLYAWQKVENNDARVQMTLEQLFPLNRNNPHYLAVRIENAGSGAGVMNSGYDGIPIDAGARYDVSFYARRDGKRGAVTATLELEDGTISGSATLDGIDRDWQKFQGVIESKNSSDTARLVLTSSDRGTLYLDMVSLFPQNTFKNRKNGLRADLAQALADLEPKFFRFPGGCIVHGHGLLNAYRWKDSVGDVAERRANWNRWGYHQTYGLGYYEYFQLCEDIGATPLPVIPVGVSCGFNQPYQCVPMKDLHIWVEDALDLIEFANGSSDSKWGKVRSEMGHPEPFELEYICLGNEEHDRPELRERFPYFVRAIRDKYPDIKIIGTSGLGPEIPLYDMMDELNIYSSDEHYYMSPQWFLANQGRFDNFDRTKPKIFIGEYASEGNTLYNAIAEAVYLTGVERNGDIVDMTCYAPLFAHVNHTQWPRADLIWFDQRTVVKTPNYYVQQLFSRNAGDVYLKNTVSKRQTKKLPTIEGAVGIGTWSTAIEMQKAEVNGKTLEPSKWQPFIGDFKMQSGLYVQTDASSQPALSISEIEYDGKKVLYTVRACKTTGNEGFLLVFGAEDNENYYWWNVGGWGNTRHGIERIENGQTTILTQKPGSIHNDIWYTMKIELTPGRVRCFLDDELIHDYEISSPSIAVSSTLDKDSDEVIVKLVNPTEESVDAKILLDGVKRVKSSGTVMLLTGLESAKNSAQEPERIKTETKSIKVAREFEYTLPPISVQCICIKTE